MLRNKLIKKQNGAISIYVIATVFSFIFILSGIFFRSNVIRKNQFRTLMKIKEIYAQDLRTKEIAQIDDKIYPNIQLAVDSVASNGEETTILLLRDTTESINIPEGKNIILDLANCTVTGDATNPTITSSGTLTVKGGTLTSANNSTIKNSGTLNIINTANIGNDSGRSDYASIYTTEGATTTISGGALTAEARTIINYGDVNISGGTLTTTGNIYSYAVYNYATLDMSGGTISTNNKISPIYNYGILNISGTANITYATVEQRVGLEARIGNSSTGTLTISGGNITADNGNAWGQTIVNRGKLNVTGGMIRTNNGQSIYSEDNGIVNVSNNANIDVIYVSPINSESILSISGGTVKDITILRKTKATITGGTITGEISCSAKLNIGGTANLLGIVSVGYTSSGGAYLNGTLNMTGGKITTTDTAAIDINQGSTATISGGTITSNNSDTIKDSGTLNISNNANIICNGTNSAAIKIENSSYGILNMTGGTVTSKGKYGIYLYFANTATISGGTIDGRNASYAIYKEPSCTATVSVSGATIYGTTYGI